MKDLWNEFKELDITQKLSIIALLIIAILFIITAIQKFVFKNEIVKNPESDMEQTNEINTAENITNSEKENIVYYTEGDEDGSFNYIVNGDDLIRDCQEMPYYYYQEMPEKLSDYLKTCGYSARELTFKEGSQYGTEYTAKFEISESEDFITVTSNLGLDDYTFLIIEDK